MPSSVTMRTVAEQAGVTQATVSLSLANHPRIPEATRRRIREIADRLGYRPNPYVAALMRARRRRRPPADRPVLALVNGLDGRHAWRDSAAPTVHQMRLGAIERARLRGYRPEEFWLHEDGMSPVRFSGMLRARGIVGVLLGPLRPGAPVPDLDWSSFAAVRLGVPLPDLDLPAVCNDHFFSSLEVVRRAHALGYRRPGLVMLRTHRARFHGRWEGGIQVARGLLPGLRPVPALLLESFTDVAPLDAWVERHRPDVIVTPEPDPVRQRLARRGRQVPRDLGLASLACPEVGHPTSGIWQNGRALGAAAVDLIISLLETNVRGPLPQAQVVMLEGIWNPGGTLRVRPDSA
jgi:DNA-binding LacI/PurR family transcriptional regulator